MHLLLQKKPKRHVAHTCCSAAPTAASLSLSLLVLSARACTLTVTERQGHGHTALSGGVSQQGRSVRHEQGHAHALGHLPAGRRAVLASPEQSTWTCRARSAATRVKTEGMCV